jgi:Arc/MetJ family transcription regulator
VKNIDKRNIETEQLLRAEAIKAFELWRKKHDKIKY